MPEAVLEFVAIVPKDTPFGLRLAKLGPMALFGLRSDFERTSSVVVDIDECDDEPGVRDSLWLTFPRYEITFRVKSLELLREFENLVFDTALPVPEK